MRTFTLLLGLIFLTFSGAKAQAPSNGFYVNSIVKDVFKIPDSDVLNNGDIVIEDNGVGISKEIQSKLFDIAENTSRVGTENETGTGTFVVTPDDVNSGEIAQFALTITSSDTLLQNISFSFPIGA